MHIIGRKEEIEIMQRLVEDNSSNFLAMYGRRRIGKTYLIREFFKEYLVFESSGVNNDDKSMQLENFWESLKEFEKKKRALPKTWLTAFRYLREYINSIKGNKKKVIFLDELAWFETPKSGFLAALDKFWNQFCTKRKDVILVICGSAASWIIKNVVNNKGGLHNRLTSTIQLLPFTIQETKAYLQDKNITLTNKDLIRLYMIMGGIPYYLNFCQKGKSIDQMVENIFFDSKAPLKNEFDNLYKALFKKSEQHLKIVQALSTKNKGLTRNEIIEIAKLKSGGGFTEKLEELILCDFVKEIIPIQNKKDDVIYKLIDEYSLFYYRFILKKRSNTKWVQYANTQEYKIWQGLSFENFVHRHINIVKKELGINGIISNEYSWFFKGNAEEKGTQIDLIIDRNDNCVNILEMKFLATEYILKKETLDIMELKKNIFIEKTKTRKNVFITMITVGGAKINEYYLAGITNQINISEVI